MERFAKQIQGPDPRPETIARVLVASRKPLRWLGFRLVAHTDDALVFKRRRFLGGGELIFDFLERSDGGTNVLLRGEGPPALVGLLDSLGS